MHHELLPTGLPLGQVALVSGACTFLATVGEERGT